MSFPPISEPVRTAPLSYQQESIRTMQVYGVSDSTWWTQRLLELHPSTDLDLLNAALNQCVKRHEILRTVFPNFRSLHAEPKQTVLPYRPQNFPFEHVTPRIGESVDACVTRHFLGDADVAGPEERPPVRLEFFVCDGRPFLGVALHHLVRDGYSTMMLLRELEELYCQGLSGKSLTLSPPPLQYAQYAQQQRQELTSENKSAELEYWRNRIDLERQQLLFHPFGSDRSTEDGLSFESTTGLLDEELVRNVVSYARQQSITTFAVYLAGLLYALRQYTGQRCVSVACVDHGRNTAGEFELMGYLAHPLPFQLDLDPRILHRLPEEVFDLLTADRRNSLPFFFLSRHLARGTQGAAGASRLFQGYITDLRGGSELNRESNLFCRWLNLSTMEEQGLTYLSCALAPGEEPGTEQLWLQGQRRFFDGDSLEKLKAGVLEAIEMLSFP